MIIEIYNSSTKKYKKSGTSTEVDLPIYWGVTNAQFMHWPSGNFTNAIQVSSQLSDTSTYCIVDLRGYEGKELKFWGRTQPQSSSAKRMTFASAIADTLTNLCSLTTTKQNACTVNSDDWYFEDTTESTTYKEYSVTIPANAKFLICTYSTVQKANAYAKVIL